MKNVFGRAILRTGITLKAIPVPFSTFLEILIIRYNVSMMWFCRTRTALCSNHIFLQIDSFICAILLILMMRFLLDGASPLCWCLDRWLFILILKIVCFALLIDFTDERVPFSPDISFSFSRTTLSSCWFSSFFLKQIQCFWWWDQNVHNFCCCSITWSFFIPEIFGLLLFSQLTIASTYLRLEVARYNSW